MIELVSPGYLGLSRWWSHTLSRMMEGQWELLDTQYQVGFQLLDALRNIPPAQEPEPPQSTAAVTRSGTGQTEDLKRRVEERLRKGLAPPPEIYEAQNRDRIDWHLLPGWARPSDPDLFDGCTHEG